MGLVGIRERADATGGHADWGPRPAGGFLVRVTWP
jgi:signal transduction histidine kinase